MNGGWVGEGEHLKAGGLLVQQLLSQEIRAWARGSTNYKGMREDQKPQKEEERLVTP